MKFLKSYGKYSEAFKSNHLEHTIAKHDKVSGHLNAVITFAGIFSVISSIYGAFKIVNYLLDWDGLAGLPIFVVLAFASVIGLYIVAESLLKLESKINILCDCIKDNIQQNEKTILAFYLEVSEFLSKHKTSEKDGDIILKIDDVIKAYALGNVQAHHITKIIIIHQYVESEYVNQRFASLSEETLAKIEQYRASLFVQEPNIETKPQYAEMM